MSSVKLHDEILDILRSRGNGWMTTHEIAALVNERGRYKKTARAKTPEVRDFQIRLRARNYPHIFQTDRYRYPTIGPVIPSFCAFRN